MAQPVLVKAYSGHETPNQRNNRYTKAAHSLPAISSFAFVDILRAADGPELQKAINGIADICAKNRLSLSDEYGSHLPPLGEITSTAATSKSRMHLRRGMRVALTSVPEASSGSSEGSRKSKKKPGIFSFRRKQDTSAKPISRMRIGSMGRTFPVGSTTALVLDHVKVEPGPTLLTTVSQSPPIHPSILTGAKASLQRLLTNTSGNRRPF